MSQKKHNFGSHICRYYDFEDQIDYVRPCDTDKFCQDTETTSYSSQMNQLYTCQKYIEIPENPKDPLKDKGQTCDDSSECLSGLSCYTTGSETTKKCNLECSTGFNLYKIDDSYVCRYVDNKCRYTKDGYTNSYSPRKCKTCGKITTAEKKDNDNKVYYKLDSADENDLYSQPDGTFVINSNACQSRTALYFYLDGKIKNEIDSTHSSENKLYYRCVSIKAVDYINKRFNYTVGSDKVYIYDIDEVEDDSSSKKTTLNNLFTRYYMTQIELWNNDKQEFIDNLACPDVNKWSDNFKRKVYYLNHPEEYLLYKDQTEVIEYLIQEAYPGIVPIQTKENRAGYLSSKYIILSLILLIL